MQSFAYQVKSELCRVPVQRICCARAEAYGVLLFCNTFTAGSNPARASLKSLIQDVSGIFFIVNYNDWIDFRKEKCEN